MYDGNLSKTFNTDNNNYSEAFWFNYSSRKTYQTIVSKDGNNYITEESFDNYPKPEFTNETENILGYLCKKAKIILRSNHIDIWYAADIHLKGSPVIYAGHELGLVLKVVRNNNYEIYADKIETITTGNLLLPVNTISVDLPTFRDISTRNNYTSIKIFENEKINFGDTIYNPAGDDYDVLYRYSKGTVIMKKVKLPENMTGSMVFADLKVSSAGDAYDRTGSLFVIPVKHENNFLNALKNGMNVLPEYKGRNGKVYKGIIRIEDYEPPVELMRFITSFGIGQFNEQVKVKDITWEDKAIYKTDITDMLPVLQGDVYIGVFIGNYDKGGHTASLSLNYHPGESLSKNPWLLSLFNTVNIMEMEGQEYGTVFADDTLKVKFTVPANVKNLKLRYITTGHGGWENGDEFNKKINYILIDNKLVHSFIPWRSDCGSFREFNPSSGNFPSGISSSDYSRSGWCPGTTVNPNDIFLGELTSGEHTLSVYIPMGKPEGNSFSSWNVSAVLIGDFE
jgi:hypothetical protein